MVDNVPPSSPSPAPTPAPSASPSSSSTPEVHVNDDGSYQFFNAQNSDAVNETRTPKPQGATSGSSELNQSIFDKGQMQRYIDSVARQNAPKEWLYSFNGTSLDFWYGNSENFEKDQNKYTHLYLDIGFVANEAMQNEVGFGVNGKMDFDLGSFLTNLGNRIRNLFK